MQSQTAVSAYFTTVQILPFGFAEHHSVIIDFVFIDTGFGNEAIWPWQDDGVPLFVWFLFTMAIDSPLPRSQMMLQPIVIKSSVCEPSHPQVFILLSSCSYNSCLKK